MSDRGDFFFKGDDSSVAVEEPLTGPTSVDEQPRVRKGAALDGLELPLEVRLGETEWRLGDVVGLRVGDAVPLPAGEDDAVTLFVQGRPYATGDLMLVDGRFAFRVRALLSGAGGRR